MTEVMAEIAESSQQQQQGVKQVDVAVGQLNQLTQHNAGSAEEAASAAEELASQAEEMQRLVENFQLDQTPSRCAPARKLLGASAQRRPRGIPGTEVSASPLAMEPQQAAANIIPFDEDTILRNF